MVNLVYIIQIQNARPDPPSPPFLEKFKFFHYAFISIYMHIVKMKNLSSEIKQNKSKCIICGGKEIESYFSLKNNKSDTEEIYQITLSNRKKIGYIQKCKNCGLIFLPGALSIDKTNYVNSIDINYVNQIRERLLNSEKLLKNFRNLMPGATLLDIGCSCGFLLKVAKEKYGLKVFGIEPSKWAIEFGLKNFGLEIKQGFIEEIDFQNEFFDAIIMADVIEHLENPKKILNKIYEILKQNGELLILTPDIGSFAAKLTGKYWWGILDGHLFYFTRKTLRQLLEDCGFEIVLLKSFGRTFLLKDWLLKISQYNRFFYILAKKITKLLRIETISLYLNLGDQMICLASKKI